MKFIQVLFLIFFLPSIAFSQERNQESFIQSIYNFAQDTRQSILIAQNKSLTDLEKVKWNNLIFWDEKNVSPFTGTLGSSPLTSTPFGSIQLFTDVTGTENITDVSGVVDISISKDWIIDKPTFQITEKTNIQSIDFFIPIIPPLKENIHNPYSLNAAFPFSLKLKKQSAPVFFTLNIDINACSQEKCIKKTYPVSFSLSQQKTLSSPFKPFIASVWGYLPKPLPNQKVFITKDNILWLDISSEYPILNADFIILSNSPVHIIQEQFIKKETFTRIILKTNPPLNNTPFRFIYSGPKGLWEISQQKPILKEIPEENLVSLPSFFQICIFFLIFSPLLSWLFLLQPRNEYEVKQKSLKTLFTFIITGSIFTLFFSLQQISFGTFLSSSFWVISCFFIFILIYLLPIKTTALSYAVLTLIAPLTYLAPAWEIASTNLQKIGLCFTLTGFACFPYIFFYLSPRIALPLLKQSRSWSPYFIKLPLLICALWYALIGGSLYINQTANWSNYSKEKIQEILQQNKIIILSIGPDWCVTCTLNRLNLTYVGLAKKLMTANRVILMTSPTNPLGKNTLFYPENIIITPRIPSGEKIPSFIHDYKMEKIFRPYLID